MTTPLEGIFAYADEAVLQQQTTWHNTKPSARTITRVVIAALDRGGYLRQDDEQLRAAGYRRVSVDEETVERLAQRLFPNWLTAPSASRAVQRLTIGGVLRALRGEE